jgi:signal transduction histidine kinase/CheY-like chemotaxis protein
MINREIEQTTIPRTFILKGRLVVGDNNKIDDIEVTYIESFDESKVQGELAISSVRNLKEFFEDDWKILRKKVGECWHENQNNAFSHYFKIFEKPLRVIIRLLRNNQVELTFMDLKVDSNENKKENERAKFLDALSRINYAILHYGDQVFVSKIIKAELQKYYFWTQIFIDQAFADEYEQRIDENSEYIDIIDFASRECFSKLKKWRNFFILTRNSKTCQKCQNIDCKMRPGIMIPLKYLDDFYGGLVVSFEPEDVYNVEMVDFLQEVAHNYSSLWYYYTLTHQPSQAKQKLEKYYQRLKERNAELEQKNSELQLLIEENRRAREQAEESDRLKLAFLGNMSHEIRTPINGIVGFAQLLKNCNLDDKASSYVDIVVDSSRNLMKLMDNIISYSKLQSNQVENQKLPCSLNKELNDLIFDYYEEYKSGNGTNVDIRNDYALEPDSDYLLLNIMNLKEILKNLLDNAFKFTHEGKIELGYTLYRDYLLFYLQDTGIGIPKDKRRIIFDHFRQSDESKNRNYGGLGLGLAIVKELMEVIGGKIWMETISGQGTTFYFTVPFEVPKENNTITLPEENFNREKIRKPEPSLIVLVENDPESSETILNALAVDHDIKHFKRGKQAIQFILSQSEISLVLLDARLPDMKGEELIKQIKTEKPGLPVIAQVTDSIEKDRQKCFTAGCDDFLIKPVSVEELFKKVDEYL